MGRGLFIVIGHGTNFKSNFGWKLDSQGDPEVYYWQGTVRSYDRIARYRIDLPADDRYWEHYWINGLQNNTKSNKLYKLTFDHANRKVGRTLVWDGSATFVHGNDTLQEFGNMTFISRDTFLITETTSPADTSDDAGGDSYRRVKIWANRLNEDGSVTPKIWSRMVLPENTADGGDSNPEAARFNYPGNVLGITQISPESPDYDSANKWANIVVVTGARPQGGPWGQSDNQHHRVTVLRLDSDNSDISNPDYLADSDAWDSGADGGQAAVSAWKTLKDFGHGLDRTDASEGFCTSDSRGNIIYGNVTGYKGVNFSQSSDGFLSAEAGGTAWYSQVGGGDRLYYHTLGVMTAPLGSVEPIDTENSGTHYLCNFNTGYSAGWQNGLLNDRVWPDFDSANDPVGDFGWGGNIYRIYNNLLKANGSCCDIFGSTKWGREHRKDVCLFFVQRNNQNLLQKGDAFGDNVNLGNPSWSSELAYNREGIVVCKQQENSNTFDILDYEDFAGTNSNTFVDNNGRTRQTYAFDSSWGTIWKGDICCENASDECDDNAFPNCVGSRPKFIFVSDDSYYTGSYYDWTQNQDGSADTAVKEAYTGDANGEIPTIWRTNGIWGFQSFHSPVAGGMSFRPNWLL